MSKYIDIHFRLSSKEEKEVIERTAKAAGKTLSEYARDVLLAASDYTVTEITNAQENNKLLQKGSRKDVCLDIRVSKEEVDFYVRQAEAAGCSVSEYIRRSADGNEIYVITGLKDLAKQIAKLGVNINQLTVLAHQGRIKEIDLFSCNDTLKQILKELVKISKKKG